MYAVQEITHLTERPIRWSQPSPGELSRWVQRCLRNSPENLLLSKHVAVDRLAQRGFSPEDVRDIVSKGVAYRAERGSGVNEYKVNFALRIRGRDVAAAVLISPQNSKVIVLTVMWADRTFLKP